jgi:hypothetical protein
MRAKYSIALFAVLAATSALAAPCPAALTTVAHEVAALRHVRGTFAPPCRIVDATELRRLLDAKLRRELPVAPELYLEALTRTGFIDGAPDELYSHLLDFYCSQVLGFYEPESDEMVIVGSPAAERVEGQLVWAHELEHAVQEHRFHLPSRLLAMRGDSDRQRAASAIAEGEAMLVMLLVNDMNRNNFGSLDRAEEAMAKQAAELSVPGVPEFFIQDLVFPYTAGLKAVLRAYRGGSWRSVDRLLADPPANTAVLLHPGEALDTPIVPTSALPAVPPGWEEVLTDTVGEWGLAFLLDRRLPHEDAARLAAAWDGDRLRLIRDRTDRARWALAWRLQCRSADLRRGLETVLQQRLPGLLRRLAPPPELQFVWTASGASLEVRAAWPPASPPPTPPS